MLTEAAVQIPLRELRWPAPSATRHVEYTVTEKCYLIEAETPCSGCTLVNVQEPEPGVVVDFTIPKTSEDRMRVDVPFVTGVLQREVDRGTNMITLMGGEPLTIKGFEDVIEWVVDNETLSGLVYSSSAYFLKRDGTPNDRLLMYEDAGLFSPKFGYFKSSVDMMITDESQIPPPGHPLRGDAFKSYYGLRLAELLTKRGHQVAIHQTLKSYTIDHARALYEWARERNVRYSNCPMVWEPYVGHGTPEAFYASHLTDAHRPELQEITNYILEDTIQRQMRGEKRIGVMSSAFLRLMPEYGPMNTLSCREHREGEQPNGQDVHPNGQLRWCIAQNTREDGMACNGCYYIGIDRDHDYWSLEHLAGLSEGDVRFLNDDVWTKDPNFDPTGENLFFDHEGRGRRWD